MKFLAVIQVKHKTEQLLRQLYLAGLLYKIFSRSTHVCVCMVSVYMHLCVACMHMHVLIAS